MKFGWGSQFRLIYGESQLSILFTFWDMWVAKGKEATAEIELQDVAANISLLDLLQGGGRDRDRDGCVKRHRERMW